MHVCAKCKGMCVRCNKKAGIALASVCEKCKIKGRCAICRQSEDGKYKETPDVEVAIENEDDFEKGSIFNFFLLI